MIEADFFDLAEMFGGGKVKSSNAYMLMYRLFSPNEPVSEDHIPLEIRNQVIEFNDRQQVIV